MKCLMCDQAETLPGQTSVRLKRNELALTFHNVPARICPHCAEAYTDETVTAHLLEQAESLALAGAKVETIEYTAIKNQLPQQPERNLHWQK